MGGLVAVRSTLNRADAHARTTLVIWACTALAAVLRLYRFVHSGALFSYVGYDDGVYFAAGARLAHGSLPYRDFVLVHPPVIAELMAPFGALAPHISITHALAVARVLSALVGIAAIPLVGHILRHRGTATVAVGCLIVAVHADIVASSRATFIEPYLTLFLLIGLAILFDRDELAGASRMFWGGLLFGVAAATKIWAFAPIVVLLVLCLRDGRRLARYAAGVVVGFVVPCLPFLLLAPGAFARDVFGSQLVRHGVRTSLWFRLSELSGLTGFMHEVARSVLVVFGVLLTALIVTGYVVLWRERRPVALEWFVVGSAGLSLVAFLLTAQFYWHYAGYLGVLLALAVALPTSKLVERAAAATWRPFALAGAGLALLALAVSGAKANLGTYWQYPNLRRVEAAIAPGRCVVTNSATLALTANRFTLSSRCPMIIDPLGQNLVRNDGLAKGPKALSNPALRRQWVHLLAKARYLLMRRQNLRWVPWRYLHRDVARHFRRVPSGNRDILIYVRRGFPRGH